MVYRYRTDSLWWKLKTDNSSLSYGASSAVWDHSVTCHLTQVKAPPPLTPTSKLVLESGFTYPGLARRDGRLIHRKEWK